MMFHSVGNFMIPTDELIFFRGVENTNQLEKCQLVTHCWHIFFVSSYHMFMKNMSCHHLFISFSSKCPKIVFSIQIFIEICYPRNRQEIPEDLRGRSSNHRQKGGLPRDGARRPAPHGLGGLSRCVAMSIQLGEIPMIHGF